MFLVNCNVWQFFSRLSVFRFSRNCMLLSIVGTFECRSGADGGWGGVYCHLIISHNVCLLYVISSFNMLFLCGVHIFQIVLNYITLDPFVSCAVCDFFLDVKIIVPYIEYVFCWQH